MKLVVHFPAIAARVSGAQLTQLEMTDDPGSRFLFELIDQLQQEPAANTGRAARALAGTAGGDRMRALAGEEMLGLEEASARARPGRRHRNAGAGAHRCAGYDELMAKGDLTDDERAELKELNVAIHMAKSRATRPSRAPAAPRR